MSVLVDSSVWSLVLRRQEPDTGAIAGELLRLIRAGQAGLIGAIRQELLSGVSQPQTFERLRARLREYPEVPSARQDYELAAEYFNACRGRGVQSSPADMLLCAVAARQEYSIFSTDRDFERYSRIIHVRLHQIH